jgi:hypothetical protein
MAAVLTETNSTEVAMSADMPANELWLSATDTAAATGWSIKPGCIQHVYPQEVASARTYSS